MRFCGHRAILSKNSKKRQGSRIDGRGDHHDDGDGEGDDVDKDKEDKEELNDVDELIEHE